MCSASRRSSRARHPYKEGTVPKMTKKGSKFVGGEIGKFMRKGPTSGPQKGKRMPQKQAVAVALNVARKKGYKVPPKPKKEAVLYRGPDYGGIAIYEDEGALITHDHNSVDASAVLAVLEQSMRPNRGSGGVIAWLPKRDTHKAIVEANIRRAMQVLGYTEDPLSERAILQVSLSAAEAPDLPGSDRFHMVHESLEAGLRRHVEVAIAALQEHGLVSPPTLKFHDRPNARDTFGRPLPFLIARAFIQPEDGAAAAEAALREALQPVESYLVRASILESDDDTLAAVEIALAPTASICEAYMDTSIPTFESHALSGARTVWLSLSAALGLEETADISALAAMSTGAVGLRTERDGRAVVAHIPSSHQGNHVADRAFHERLGWLVRLLDPWNPEVRDIGEQMAVAAGAPSQRDGLSEGDLDPSPVPSRLDAEAIRDLELHLDNTSRLYAQKRNIERSQTKRLKAGTFRRDLAAKGWMYWVDAGAKDFVREFGGSWNATFPKKEREFLAMQYARHTERRYRDGEITAESLEESAMLNAAIDKINRYPNALSAWTQAVRAARDAGRSIRFQLGSEDMWVVRVDARTSRVKPDRPEGHPLRTPPGWVRIAYQKVGANRRDYKYMLSGDVAKGSFYQGKGAGGARPPKVDEAITEASREQVADTVLGPEAFNLNVGRIDVGDARRYAEQLYAQADADLEADLPNLDKNFAALKAKMRHALTIRRKDMPVIDPKDIPKFGKRLQRGHIDIFKPLANMAAIAPELGGERFPTWHQMQGGTKGRIWVSLGKADGDADDDRIEARVGMVAVKDLKPLQNEIWYDKLIASVLKFGPPAAGGFLLTKAIIIVSKEGYILDGHHRFGQAMLTDPNLKIKALQVPLDIDTLLKVGRSYGSAIGRAPRESVDEKDIVKTRGKGKETTPDTPKGSVVKVGAPHTPTKDIPDEMSVLKQKLKAARERLKRGEKAPKTDEAAGARLVYAIKPDPRYPGDIGARIFKAWWPETMVSATGAARSVALERWQDGGWRAAGEREPHKTADDAARAWLAKKNEVSPRQMDPAR